MNVARYFWVELLSSIVIIIVSCDRRQIAVEEFKSIETDGSALLTIHLLIKGKTLHCLPSE